MIHFVTKVILVNNMSTTGVAQRNQKQCKFVQIVKASFQLSFRGRHRHNKNQVYTGVKTGLVKENN